MSYFNTFYVAAPFMDGVMLESLKARLKVGYLSECLSVDAFYVCYVALDWLLPLLWSCLPCNTPETNFYFVS